MKTVDELVYYCHECEPVGALLLSGEWGCGKTYLIEHELKNALADTSVVLRISLFGMTLPEEIHIAVRREWMTEYCKIKGVDKVAKKIGQGKKWLSRMDFLPEWLRGIAKTDASVFFPISKEMDGKDVILVFDDLERCRMSSVDVLGVINDYCENQHYHTIIVANQAKIKGQREITKITGEIQQVPAESDTRKSENNKAIIKVDIPVQPEQAELSYAEIKEKIIQRTVYYLPDYENIVFTVKAEDKDSLEKVGTELLTCPAALSISYTSSLSAQVDRMLSTLDVVILVLIVSAGMLAFVVLYNLNNINITERQRELATLKVLGFYDGEVASYVYRENILLTIIGSVVGMVLGNLLHRYIILTVEVEEAMFGRQIHWQSYLYSFLFTVAFSLFVNWVMFYKLKKIDMVESLKSVE